MNREVATAVQREAISAIEALHNALTFAVDKCSDEDFQLLRYGVGSSIAVINTDLLSVVYERFPELNHIK